MADKEGFDVGRDLPAFLASVSDRTEHIFQNDVGEGAAEVHAEVVNQSVRMRRLLRDCHDIGTSDKEKLDSLAAAFADVLLSLNHHITVKSVIPETVDENGFSPLRRKRKLLEDHILIFLLRCWKKCVNWGSIGLRVEDYWVFQGGQYTGELNSMVCKIWHDFIICLTRN